MASIITATTTSGLTQSADNSGVLQLASGTGNLVTVPSVTGTAMVSGNMPAFSAYASTSQSISINTTTKVTLDTETFDTNNNFASSRFTPTVAGYYQINAKIRGVSTSNGMNLLLVNIYKNGASNCSTQFNVNAPVYAQECGVSTLVYLNGSTDYIELYGTIYGTGTPTFNFVDSSVTSSMSGVLVRAA